MADASGITTTFVTQATEEKPYALDFFQAVRRLECLNPEMPRVGCSSLPQNEYIRFGQHVSLCFAPSAMKDISSPRSGLHQKKILVDFLGLLGPNGPLPLHLTEYVRERLLNHRDRTLASFLDIFNHRMIALFYRAWSVTHPCPNLDRPQDDRFSRYILSLFGFGQDSLQNRDSVPDNAKRYYSGRLVCQTRNAEGLQAIVQDFFSIKTEIKQFMGRWIILPDIYQCQIGKSVESCIIGANIIVGQKVWDCQQKFRICMGPMDFEDYQRMLPGGSSFQRLKDWIRNYILNELSWDVQLVLLADQVPDISLGKQGRLGFSTWVKSRPFPRDADDLILIGD